MTEFSAWHDFFVMVGGGAAALTGLVFVAMTLHLQDIVHDPVHRHRARTILTGLTAVFIRCGLVLMAAQPRQAIAVELFAVLVVVEVLVLVVELLLVEVVVVVELLVLVVELLLDVDVEVEVVVVVEQPAMAACWQPLAGAQLSAVQGFPSSQLIGLWVQPLAGAQPSVVQMFASSQLIALPTHWPARQAYAVVQALASLHGVPLATGACVQTPA